MSNEPTAPKHSPRLISDAFLDGAKLFSGTSLGLKTLAVGVGAYFVLANIDNSSVPWLLVALAAAAEASDWRSDILKERGENLKRNLEYQDGLGWPLLNTDLSDYLVLLSNTKRRSIELRVAENYFASTAPPGPTRAIENLQESAWWSKHLAGTMVKGCACLTAILILVSLGALVTSISAIKVDTTLQNASRIVSSVISMILSLGLARSAGGYFLLAKKSEEAESKTIHLLSSKQLDILETLHLITEYQVARAMAPLIPNWLWQVRRGTLNDLWKNYRRLVP